jgi:hypothetical protein
MDNEIILFLQGPNGADAIGRLTPDGILVLQNSRIATVVDPSLQQSLIDLRERLIKEEIIAEKGDLVIFDLEYLFSDPSQAAAIVLGREADGSIEWKSRDGKSLEESVLNKE